MIFEILNFEFYLQEKKATVNYCLYECKHIKIKKMKDTVYPPPNIVR